MRSSYSRTAWRAWELLFRSLPTKRSGRITAPLLILGGMNAVVTVLAASVITFAATNIDDLCLLTLFFARRIPTHRIVAGQYLGFALIILLSCAGSVLALAVPVRFTRFLGLLPLALGIKGLLQFRSVKGPVEPYETNLSLISIMAITLSNCADNLAVYIPFFRFNRQHLWLILSVYGVLIGIWCLAGRWLGRHPVIRSMIDRLGHRLVPFVFIGFGFFVLAF